MGLLQQAPLVVALQTSHGVGGQPLGLLGQHRALGKGGSKGGLPLGNTALRQLFVGKAPGAPGSSRPQRKARRLQQRTTWGPNACGQGVGTQAGTQRIARNYKGFCASSLDAAAEPLRSRHPSRPMAPARHPQVGRVPQPGQVDGQDLATPGQGVGHGCPGTVVGGKAVHEENARSLAFLQHKSRQQSGHDLTTAALMTHLARCGPEPLPAAKRRGVGSLKRRDQS